jgi:hypothetical protein
VVLRKTMIALAALASIGLVSPDIALARGGFGGGGGGHVAAASEVSTGVAASMEEASMEEASTEEGSITTVSDRDLA